MLERASGVTVVWHPPVNCRMDQAAAALALSTAGRVALLSTGESIGWWMHLWIGDAKPVRIAGLSRYDLGGCDLWIAHDVASLRAAPVARFDLLIIHGAHELEHDALVQLVGRYDRAILTSEPVSRDHWLRRDFAHRQVKLPHAELVVAFPDLATQLRPEASRRELALSSACMKYLKVRTSKPPEYLSPLQRAEAEAQYGTSWFAKRQPPLVTMQLSKVQRKVEAMERVGRRRGYRKFLILKPRRAGETLRNFAKNYLVVRDTEGANVLSLADTGARSTSMFGVVKEFAKNDHDGPAVVKENTTELKLANGSTYMVGTAGSSAVARSMALQRVHGFEVAYWCQGPNQVEDVNLVVAGLQEAAQTGEMVFESTPNGREWFCNTYVEGKQGTNDVWPIFIRWWDDPTNVARPGTYNPQEIQDTLTEEERALNLSLAQVAFRREKKRGLKKLFDQEFPEDDVKCFLTSGLCYFDTDLLLALDRKLVQVGSKQIPGGHYTEWEAPVAGEEYVLGADTSEGLPGCDPSGFGVLSRKTGRQVAQAHGYFKPGVLARHIYDAHVRYNKAVVGVERENHGHAVILELQKLMGRAAGPLEHGGYLYHYQENRAGWSTNEASRALMLTALSDYLELGHVRDPLLLAECYTFRLQKGGKFEADPGAHDDSVMKWAVAVKMLEHRRHRGGIMVMQGSV